MRPRPTTLPSTFSCACQTGRRKLIFNSTVMNDSSGAHELWCPESPRDGTRPDRARHPRRAASHPVVRAHTMRPVGLKLHLGTLAGGQSAGGTSVDSILPAGLRMSAAARRLLAARDLRERPRVGRESFGDGLAINEMALAPAGDQPGFAQNFEMMGDGC